ncbi:MAG: ABC transporter ATP-binding protein [Chlamydiae bacterium]|nr:ABC transporter ATP-binding protein [Chlamydiota bacterium]
MEKQEIAISCRGIKKTYGTGETGVIALRGVDFDVMKGELLMIVGPSGSGKTTLISIIAGILDQDEGECIVFGENLRKMSNGNRTNFRGKNIGFVFQSFNLIPMLTSTENVSIPLLLNGLLMNEALEKARELLRQLGLGDKINERPSELSSGQQQRVAIARASIHGPLLIVCDEPTSALDHETGIKVLELLKQQVIDKNRCLIVVTHDARIFSFADRIIKLDDGRIASNQVNNKI